MGSWHQDHFINLKWRRDQEVSVHTIHTIHTSRSHSQSGSHISHKENTRAMQLEIDRLRRKLCYERWRQTPSNSDFSSGDEGDGSYRPRSRILLSESFLCDENYHQESRNKSPSRKGLGNDAMSRALNQISRSPFTCRIEGGKLPRRFTQPTFTMYSGQTNTVEHVSHFNQRMAVHLTHVTNLCDT